MQNKSQQLYHNGCNLGDFADVEVGGIATEDAEGYRADPDFFLAEAREGCGVVMRAARQRLVELDAKHGYDEEVQSWGWRSSGDRLQIGEKVFIISDYGRTLTSTSSSTMKLKLVK